LGKFCSLNGAVSPKKERIMSTLTKGLVRIAVVLAAFWMINGAVAQQLPAVPNQEEQLDWITKPPPWVMDARAALIRGDPSFGPGKIDLTEERVMVSAVSWSLVSSFCPNSNGPYPSADMVVLFMNVWGHSKDARFQALLEEEVVSSIQVLRGVPEVRDIFCIFGEKISSMMHTLFASAENAFAHEPKAMKTESTR
jgi:hypothetical protein